MTTGIEREQLMAMMGFVRDPLTANRNKLKRIEWLNTTTT